MRFRRKKQGSSFIFVVIMFMFVTVVSTAMLSMVSGNYKARVSESKRVHNLYGAESGLDIAYNVAAKTVEKANIYAVDCTEKFRKYVKSISKYDKIEDKITINEIEFSKADIQALYALYEHLDYLKMTQGDETSCNGDIDKLLNCIFKKSFKNYIDSNLKNDIQNGKINGENVSYGQDVELEIVTGGDNGKLNWELDNQNSNNEKIELQNSSVDVFNGYDEDGNINPTQRDIRFKYESKKTSDINITSNFTTDRNNTDETIVGKNPREIQVTFSVTVPNYDEVSFKNSITYPSVRDIPGLTVGGNMIVKNSNLNVTGDIFVEGTTPVVSPIDRTYKKYDSGIKINSTNTEKNKINFNDNVYTRETFNIKNNVNVNIKGDLYAKNVYAGNSDSNGVSSGNSKFKVNNTENTDDNQKVVVDNDLAIKAENTEISIDNFYGISDINGKTGEGVERKSSSIIVNNQKSENTNSKITIENKAYIAGVAHINTEGDGYQTGESVAVKGNYNAYSVPQSESDEFEYKNPLHLLKPHDSSEQNKLDQKSNHFFDYWKNIIIPNTDENEARAKDSMDCGGVIFLNPYNNTTGSYNVKSVGALVYKDGEDSKVVKPRWNIESFNSDSEVIKNRSLFALYTKKLIGDKSEYFNDNSELKEEKKSELEELYSGEDKDAHPETVQDDILKELHEDYGLTSNIITNNGEKILMFCSDKKTSIVIKGKNNSSQTTGNYMIDVSEDNANNNVNAVIVTNGDVLIDGDVNFRGDIITSGNLEIKGNGINTVNLYYDSTLTRDIQNENLLKFAEVFGHGGAEIDNTLPQNTTSSGASFLKTKQWRIIK